MPKPNNSLHKPVLLSVCTDCLPHAPLPLKRGGGSSSNPYCCYVTVKPEGLVKGKKNSKRTVPKTRFQTSAVFAAISFTSQLAFCCCTHKQVCPLPFCSPQGCVISRRRTILGTIQKHESILSSLPSSEGMLQPPSSVGLPLHFEFWKGSSTQFCDLLLYINMTLNNVHQAQHQNIFFLNENQRHASYLQGYPQNMTS